MLAPDRSPPIPAGLADSAAASLASFVAGLLAIHTLDVAGLGVYAVFFGAFLAGSYLPRHLVFLPIEMASVQLKRAQRKTLVGRSLRIGAIPSLIGAGVIGLAVLATISRADSELLMQLTITAALATFLSPIQDHVRRILHLSDRSWGAALVSITQLAVVAVVAILAVSPIATLDVDSGWLPFGALVLANLASLIVGLLAAATPATPAAQLDLSYGSLSRPGRWLLLSALATKGSLFMAAALIGHFAGDEALGYAEAARIVAQPVMVLGIGLADVIGPRLMEAAHRRDRRRGRSAERYFLKIFWPVGLLYLAGASGSWVGNPMAFLVPEAYEITGLVAVSILANLIASAVYPYRAELLGGGKERPLALVDVASASAPLLLGLFSAATLSFARPLGQAGQGAIQMFGYGRSTIAMYNSAENPIQDQQQAGTGGEAPAATDRHSDG